MIKDGKTIAGNSEGEKSIKSGMIMWTSKRESTESENENKCATQRFKRISDDVREVKRKKQALTGIKVYGIVETIILTGQHQGVWIKARIIRINENTMDIRVLKPRKWNVMGVALAVPKQFIRAVKDRDLYSYTIPIKFTLDDSVLYISCNEKMKVDELKRTIHKVRIYPIDQIYFLHDGEWLNSHDTIPNGIIFCIIHRGQKSNNNLIDLVTMLKKKILHSATPSYSEISSLEGADKSFPCSSYTREDSKSLGVSE